MCSIKKCDSQHNCFDLVNLSHNLMCCSVKLFSFILSKKRLLHFREKKMCPDRILNDWIVKSSCLLHQ